MERARLALSKKFTKKRPVSDTRNSQNANENCFIRNAILNCEMEFCDESLSRFYILGLFFSILTLVPALTYATLLGVCCVHQSISPSVRQFICPSVHQSVSPTVCQSVRSSLTTRQSISPSVCQSISPFGVYPFFCLCNRPFIWLFVCRFSHDCSYVNVPFLVK